LIGIGAAVVLAIPMMFVMWKVFKRVLGVFDSVEAASKSMSKSANSDPLADLNAMVTKLTSPGANPFMKPSTPTDEANRIQQRRHPTG
jgi:hypothetical protein